ncbi:hypothetical protein KJ910_02160 [Patescibacteria group bacterium]|nr:hypothetical protein [Patescibacteria group bacterium]MBU1907387.1 hypothetical protein [Patescibacteria group bacterium]
MPNIMDLSEALALEGRLAQEYEDLGKQVKSKSGKKDMNKLSDLSKEKMSILLELIKKGKWNV